MLFVCSCFDATIKIECCPDFCRCDRTIGEVNCAGANITQVQNVISQMPSDSKTLILSENNIDNFTIIDKSLVFRQLKKVDFGDNKLKEFPSVLGLIFPDLQVLVLNSNDISNISEEDFKFFNALQVLSLQDNQIVELPERCFSMLPNLRRLVLSGNKIQTLSTSTFDSISTDLVGLNLNDNALNELPDGVFNAFTNPALKLFLNNNQLTSLPAKQMFPKLKTIAHLNLYQNQLNAIPEATFRGTMIKVFNLASNKLSSVPSRLMFHILFLTDNPLNCSCGFSDFIIHAKDIGGNTFGSCHTSTRKSLQIITKLNKNEIRREFCDECQLRNICLNGALCVAVNKTKIECRCTANYTGQRCEKSPEDDGKSNNQIIINDNSENHACSVIIIVICATILLICVCIIAVVCVTKKTKGRKNINVNDQTDLPNENTYLL